MRKPKRKPRKPHTDTRNLLRHPEKIPGALAAIAPVEPPESVVAAFRALVDAVGRAEGDTPAGGHSGGPGGGAISAGPAGDAGSAGVVLARELPRANCVALLGRLVDGCPYAEALEAAGLSWAQVYLCERLDPDGFGTLLRAAGQFRDRIFKARARDALMQRAVEGVERPLIGRIGKDLDGVVATERRYSDKLLEFGLARLDREQFGEPDRRAANVSIGHQVVYNIQGVPIGVAAPPIEAESTEIPAETGATPPALPDLDD
jgi:hypothetical protein